MSALRPEVERFAEMIENNLLLFDRLGSTPVWVGLDARGTYEEFDAAQGALWSWFHGEDKYWPQDGDVDDDTLDAMKDEFVWCATMLLALGQKVGLVVSRAKEQLAMELP